jgi:hypothetical protein
VQIVYLDQNKWIDLSRAVKYPADYPEQRTVLEVSVEEAKAGRIAVPLTLTNIYETRKINDPERGRGLAYVQATFEPGSGFPRPAQAPRDRSNRRIARCLRIAAS